MTTKATDPSERTSDMSLASPKESLELEKILNDFRQSTIIIHSIGSVKGVEEDARAFKASLDDAITAITTLHDVDIEYILGEFPDDTPEANEMWKAQRQRWQERRL